LCALWREKKGKQKGDRFKKKKRGDRCSPSSTEGKKKKQRRRRKIYISQPRGKQGTVSAPKGGGGTQFPSQGRGGGLPHQYSSQAFREKRGGSFLRTPALYWVREKEKEALLIFVGGEGGLFFPIKEGKQRIDFSVQKKKKGGRRKRRLMGALLRKRRKARLSSYKRKKKERRETRGVARSSGGKESTSGDAILAKGQKRGSNTIIPMRKEGKGGEGCRKATASTRELQGKRLRPTL